MCVQSQSCRKNIGHTTFYKTDNVLDKDPPYRSTNAFGAAFYNLGRVTTLGIRTTF